MIKTWLEKTKLVRELRENIRKLYLELYATRDALRELTPRPARLKLEGTMTADHIERALAGSENSPVVKAIVARISAKVVQATDIATDEPRETRVVDGRTLEGYSERRREYDAGRASAFAEMLSDLQELAAPRPEVAATKRAA